MLIPFNSSEPIVRDEERIKRYFSRIGLEYSASCTPDGELLRRLQYAHVTTVPYENLDILRGVPISLKLDDIYDKVILRHRGGYCFELNALFGWLLRQLGYLVIDLTARFLRGESEIPMRRHRVLRVTDCFGDEWLADVGVGQQVPRMSLRLAPNIVQEQLGEFYRFRVMPDYGWVLYDLRDTEWREVFAFTEERQLDIDFEMPSFWCEANPTSPFRKKEMLSIKTSVGRMTIDGNEFKIFDSGNVSVKLLTDDEKPYYREKYFGITLDEKSNI